MKATKLQIHDWVKVYDDDSHQTSRFRRVTGVNYYDLEVFYNEPGSPYIDVCCDDVDCEPIPLIREILEKNGFVLNRWGEYENGAVSVLPATNKSMFSNIDYPTLSIYGEGHSLINRIRCDYVHTMQHALRLCGLNDMADNFIIL